MMNLLKKNAFVFALVVLVHLAYKMLFLDFSGFWHDEAFSLYFSQQHWGHLKHISEWDINPPLYYYFLWIWQHLFGNSEYAIRFSSVIFSALSAGMLYVLCARNFNRLTGVIAVLFFSVSNEIYFYSHEARPYSLILFFALCSSWFFFELLRKPGWLYAVALGILNFGLLYTHYVCALVIAVQTVLVLLYFNKQLLKFFGVALGVTALISLLRFTKKTIALVFNNKKSSFWIEKPHLQDLTDTFYNFFNGPDLFFIFLFAALVALVYLVRSRQWKPLWNENKVKLTYVWLAGPGALIICFLISQFMPLFVRRYILFTAPFIYITLAWFISRAGNNVRFPLYAAIAIFLGFSLLRIDYKAVKSMDYRNGVAFVKSMQKGNVPVLVETRDVAALFAYYYDRSIFEDYGKAEDRLREKNIFMVGNTADAQAVDMQKNKELILTKTFDPQDGELQQLLDKFYPHKKVYTNYRGIIITVYSK